METQMEFSKMRSELSEKMWKTRVILIHLENYFENKHRKFGREFG